ncbi:hypothetical protein NDU88_001344 [Pleurodeles waltl]|uniref:Uncharacterized protein n=1 Tax=Pleurodeles waltl TaxID=8319 RepID=A0AAV7WI25_PLEWA|nr:hypothetical protein NDU88_001344 [Pleurodeles waltl]
MSSRSPRVEELGLLPVLLASARSGVRGRKDGRPAALEECSRARSGILHDPAALGPWSRGEDERSTKNRWQAPDPKMVAAIAGEF